MFLKNLIFWRISEFLLLLLSTMFFPDKEVTRGTFTRNSQEIHSLHLNLVHVLDNTCIHLKSLYRYYQILYGIFHFQLSSDLLCIFLALSKSENTFGIKVLLTLVYYCILPTSKNIPYKFKTEMKPIAAMKLKVYSESLGGIESI